MSSRRGGGEKKKMMMIEEIERSHSRFTLPYYHKCFSLERFAGEKAVMLESTIAFGSYVILFVFSYFSFTEYLFRNYENSKSVTPFICNNLGFVFEHATIACF